MEAQRVIDLLERLDEFAVAVWLDGGWGVEALLGTQKRSHDDLDLIREYPERVPATAFRVEELRQLQAR